jgi:hypothetical protein
LKIILPCNRTNIQPAFKIAATSPFKARCGISALHNLLQEALAHGDSATIGNPPLQNLIKMVFEAL